MTVFNKLKVLFQSKTSNIEGEAVLCPLTNDTVNILKQHSIACKCGGMAVPISKRGNVFRCIHCTEEHRYMNYHIGRLKSYLAAQGSDFTANEDVAFNMDHYNNAIKLLQEEFKNPHVSLKNYFKT
ncbi:MAG: hypothetical protein L0G25_02110 [Psychrobacter sp.]|nr:hypothetical protein [Psychrobacter sp.]